MTATTRHVVLVTYGEPPTPAFVDQLVYSWRILVGLTRTVAPIPRPLLPLIALSRARGRRRMWSEHAYGSPLEPITVKQADGLRQVRAADPGTDWTVHVAYEFRQPLLADVLASIPDGAPVWVAPMYAADSAFTHALSRTTAAAHRAATGRRVQVLDALDPELLADLSAAHVLAQLDGPEPWRGADVALVLAAHGTVLNPPTPIDTGLVATEALRTAIATRLTSHFGMVTNGWLNHTRGGQVDRPADRGGPAAGGRGRLPPRRLLSLRLPGRQRREPTRGPHRPGATAGAGRAASALPERLRRAHRGPGGPGPRLRRLVTGPVTVTTFRVVVSAMSFAAAEAQRV